MALFYITRDEFEYLVGMLKCSKEVFFWELGRIMREHHGTVLGYDVSYYVKYAKIAVKKDEIEVSILYKKDVFKVIK